MRNTIRIGVLALAVTGAGASLAQGGSPQDGPRVLPRPPFNHTFSGGAARPRTKLRLVKSSERRHQITEEQSWLRRHGLALPDYGADLARNRRGRIPAAAESSYADQRLIGAVKGTRHAFLLYGPDFSGARYVVAMDPDSGEERYALDFRHYLEPPSAIPADREFVDEPVQWVQEADGLLYVSNFHRTYARSSRGHNGYLTALDPRTGRMRWRSRPLVCNTRNFLVSGDALLTGYGFTAEPDYLYVLDRGNGSVAQTIRLKSGPELLALKDGKLFVRTYDTEHVFRLKR